jgi:alkane 1-monooxygenase
LAAFAGIYTGGIWTPGAVYVGFVIIPVLELFVPGTEQNMSDSEEQNQAGRMFYDVLLYLNLPILYGLLAYFFFTLNTRALNQFEICGMIASVGVILSTSGINVAHELGHRSGSFNKWVARLLLLPSLYMHFTIEHNNGHHKNVSTPGDPATARKGESVYYFWFRSVTGSFINAWKIEFKRLAKLGRSKWHYTNELIWSLFAQAGYLSALWFLGSPLLFLAGIIAAIIGFLLLESVNYVEHYGLLRKKLSSGNFERVNPSHSWNSNHIIGRIFLYELTRHADHHYKASRKFQILRHKDDSPQLPFGYPMSILISLLPPVWFKMMDPKVEIMNHM